MLRLSHFPKSQSKRQNQHETEVKLIDKAQEDQQRMRRTKENWKQKGQSSLRLTKSREAVLNMEVSNIANSANVGNTGGKC